jgi:hypothetical protein
MRFMIMVRANADTEAGRFPEGEARQQLFQLMTDFHEQLAKAGVLLDAAGLQPSSKGWRIQYDGQQRRVLDGPFAESKELIAGYTLIQVRSREEAMEWARRYPNPAPLGVAGEIEVRPLYELEDLEAQGPIDSAEQFRRLVVR